MNVYAIWTALNMTVQSDILAVFDSETVAHAYIHRKLNEPDRNPIQSYFIQTAELLHEAPVFDETP